MKKLALAFLCVLFSGCYDIILNEEDNGYETIDGLWHVNIPVLENTCHPEEGEVFEGFDAEMFVTVQEWPEGGGYLADFFFQKAKWLNVEIAADGNFLYESVVSIITDVFEGNIIPGRIDAVFGYRIGSDCERMFEMYGYQPFIHNTPPGYQPFIHNTPPFSANQRIRRAKEGKGNENNGNISALADFFVWMRSAS